MSLYAQYLKEKTNDHIIETDYGFATYRFIDSNNSCYLTDIFILPDLRQKNLATKLADQVCMEAKARGCSSLIGSVIPSNKDSTISLKVLLEYQMKLLSCESDIIYFRKDI